MLLSTTVVSTRNFLPCVTPRSCASSTTRWCNCSMTFGSINCPSRARVLASGTFSSPIRVKARYTRLARTSRSSTS